MLELSIKKYKVQLTLSRRIRIAEKIPIIIKKAPKIASKVSNTISSFCPKKIFTYVFNFSLILF